MEHNAKRRIPTFVDPTSDWGFKKILGSEANAPVLMSLLNAIIDDREITGIEYLNTEHVYSSVETGRSIFDVYCRCDDGSRIIIEMQNQEVPNFLGRALAYSAMSIMDQAQLKWRYDFSKVYFIGFLNYQQFPTSDEWFHKLALMDVQDPQSFMYENYLQIYVELPKFAVRVDRDSPLLDKWVYCMKNARQWESRPDFLSEAEFDLFCRAAKFNALSETDQKDYLKTMLTKEEYQDAMELAKQRAEAKGRAEGIKETASNFKRMGIPVSQIVQATGLSEEEVLAL